MCWPLLLEDEMEYEIGKTFKSGGKLLKPGEPLPDGLDKVTLEHYKRHGMVREVKPQEAKPEASKRRTVTQRPREIKPVGPGDSSQLAGQSVGGAQVAGTGEHQAGSTVHTSAQDAVDPDSGASQDLPVGSEDAPETNN